MVAVVANKRSAMTLFSGVLDPYSHQVRIVLSEKRVAVDIVEVSPGEKPEDLLDLNPYNSVPTLVDRKLVLYEPRVIIEYLDERFPHPPLMPVYPVTRAESRLRVFRIEKEWFSLMHKIELDELDEPDEAELARKQLQESLISISPVFANKPYFMSDEFTVVDCCIASMFWRLPNLGIPMEELGKSIMNYAERVFARDSFQASLTDVERDLHDA